MASVYQNYMSSVMIHAVLNDFSTSYIYCVSLQFNLNKCISFRTNFPLKTDAINSGLTIDLICQSNSGVSIIEDALLLSHGTEPRLCKHRMDRVYQRLAFLQLHRCVLHGLSAWQEHLISLMKSSSIRATPSGTVPDTMCLFLHVVTIHAMWHQDLVDENPLHAARGRPVAER